MNEKLFYLMKGCSVKACGYIRQPQRLVSSHSTDVRSTCVSTPYDVQEVLVFRFLGFQSNASLVSEVLCRALKGPFLELCWLILKIVRNASIRPMIIGFRVYVSGLNIN